MFLKFTKRFGKPVCVALYAAFSALAAMKMWIPLAVLVVMHLTEYGVVVYRMAKQYRLGQITAFVNCLCFGFTWWLPLRENLKNRR